MTDHRIDHTDRPAQTSSARSPQTFQGGDHRVVRAAWEQLAARLREQERGEPAR